MRVQEVVLANGCRRYVLLDDDGEIVVPVARFLKFLDQSGRARNTLRGYAYSLRLYFGYLDQRGLSYRSVALDDMAAFVRWLKTPQLEPEQITTPGSGPARSEATVNQILTAVAGLYDYLWRSNELPVNLNDRLSRVLPAQAERSKPYKGFLHHAAQTRETRGSILTQRVARRRPKTCTKNEIECLVAACSNQRDRLLLMLLYESSLRVGEALALWIEDVDIPRMKLHVRDRGELANGAEIKTPSARRSVDVSRDLINKILDYIAVFHTDEVETNHLLIKLQGVRKGQPMTYTDVNNLFIRLRESTGIAVTPHMFRHSSLTALSKAGWNPEHLRIRAGHRQFQTTVQMYVHPSDEELQEAWELTQSALRIEEGSDNA